MNEKPGDLIVNVHTDTPEEVDDNIVETSDESLKDASKTKQSETVDNQVDSSHHYNEPLISPEAVLRFKEDLRTDGISEEFIEELAKVRIENDEKNAGINTDVGAEIKNLEQVLEASPNIVAVDSNELHITDAESGEAVMTATDTEPAQNSLDRHDADLAAQAKLEKEAQGFDSTNNVVPFPNDAVFRTREEVARNQESLEDKLEMIKSRKPQTPDDVLTNHSDKQALLEEYDEYRNRIPEEDNFLETELSIAKGADDGNSAEDDIPTPEPLSQDSKHVELDVEPFPQNEGPNKIIVEESEDVVLETPKQEGVSKKLAPETAEKEEINTDGIEVEEVSEEIVMEGDTSSSSEDIGRDESEETVEKLDSFKNTEIFSEFGISSEDLTQIKGFKELSHGQRILVANGLKHLIKEEVPAKAKDTADRKLKESGFMGRMLRNIGKGGLLEKYKNEELKNLKAGGIEMHKDVLEEFVRDAQNGLGTEELEDGSVRFEFVPQYENLTPSQMETISKFNDFANAFANMPKSWVENGDDMQKESYAHAKLRYEEMTQQVIALELDRSGNNEDAALDFTNNIEGRVRMAQYMNGHPEIEKELNSIENNKVGRMAAGFLKTGAEYGGYFAFGFAARTAAVSALSLAGAPLLAVGGGVALTAGAIGGYRARKRAVESISDEDSKTVRGIESESATEKKLSDAEAFARNLERDAQQLEDAETDEQRARLAEKLITRYEVTMEKINDKAFVMGEGAKKIRNMSNMGYAISHAEAVLKLHQDAEAKSKVTEKYNQLITYANERAEEARGKKLKKSFWTGATISAAIAGAGFAARGIMEAYNTPETEVETAVSSEAPQQEASTFQEMLEKAKQTVAERGTEAETGVFDTTYEMKSGDSLWKGIESKLEEGMFTENMDDVQKTHLIDAIKDKYAAMSAEDLAKDGLKDGINNIDKDAVVNLSVLKDTEFMNGAMKDALSLSEYKYSSIAENIASSEGGEGVVPETVAENVPIETGAQVADSIATETVPAEHVAENVAAEETLEKNGIIIEKENELAEQTTTEDTTQTERDAAVLEQQVEELKTGYSYSEENLGEWAKDKETLISSLSTKEGRNAFLYETTADGNPVLEKTSEGMSILQPGVRQERGLLLLTLDNLRETQNIEPLPRETIGDYMNRAYGELAEGTEQDIENLKNPNSDNLGEVLDTNKNTAEEVLKFQESLKQKSLVDTPDYGAANEVKSNLVDNTSAESSVEPQAESNRSRLRVVNDFEQAAPATPEQLASREYLLNNDLNKSDYKYLEALESRNLPKENLNYKLQEIFKSTPEEQQALSRQGQGSRRFGNFLANELNKRTGGFGNTEVGRQIGSGLRSGPDPETYRHGLSHEWNGTNNQGGIKGMPVRRVLEDSFLEGKDLNLIEENNRTRLVKYLRKLQQDVPIKRYETTYQYLLRARAALKS